MFNRLLLFILAFDWLALAQGQQSPRNFDYLPGQESFPPEILDKLARRVARETIVCRPT